MAVAVPSTVPASLYVGDLRPDVTDGQLFDAFSDFKSLASVRICRDSSSGRSLCYAYVNFLSPQDAIRAIETKNHTTLNGKLMRVTWSHRDPDARRSGVGNLFVKNFSDTIDNVGLEELFREFGNILSCKIAVSEDGKSKGYGFVQFESEDSANSAIEKLNGKPVGDKLMYVAKFVKKSDRVLPDAKYTNLFIKNLDPDVTEEVLQEKFSKFGKIASLVIVRDSNGTSRGFGFVNFDEPDDARRAVEGLNGSECGSKQIYVGRAQKKAEREQMLRHQFEEKRKEQIQKYKASNVYVKNIEDNVTDEELKELFSQCGTITSSRLMRDAKGMSRGFGFVCFSNHEEANNAVGTFHGCMFHGKPLYVAIAQKKEDRQAQLQMQYAHRLIGLPGPSTGIIPGGYAPLYYTGPSEVVSQVPPGPSGLMYQPLAMRPGWRADGFVPSTRPTFQPTQLPVMPNTQRQHRPSRGRINGHMLPHGDPHAVSYMQQPAQSQTYTKYSNNQRGGHAKYASNGGRPLNKGSGVPPGTSNPAGALSQGSETLSSMLAAASPESQKQILGEQLYPLIQKLKPDLVAKITGMLLEMDNAELLLLLESPQSLASKVEEAVEVLNMSKTKVSGPENLHPSFLTSEVAVN